MTATRTKARAKTAAEPAPDVLSSFRACAPLFHALGDVTRQDIILLLVENERLNVGQIAERMPLSRPTISHHLKVLLQAGVVSLQRESRENFYALDINSALACMKQLVVLTEASCTRTPHNNTD